MINLPLSASIVFAVAEVAGAWIFHSTANSARRHILSAFGLGFAAMVVVCDVLPDATEHYPPGYALALCGAIAAFILWRRLRRIESSRGAASLNSVAVGGMALHNFAEGVILSAFAGPFSPLLAVGAILHKLPEGMATYTMLGEKRNLRNLLVVSGSALLIPMGVLLRLPQAILQPGMALLSGVILAAVLTTALAHDAFTDLQHIYRRAAPYMAGALIGGISCLLA